MTKSISPIFAFFVLLTSSAFAGSEGGNGGHGIVCVKNGKKTVVQYDYYEGIDKYHLVYDLGGPDATVDEKVHLVLDRIKRLNPTRANTYEQWYATFHQEAEFVRGKELIFIPDAGDGEIPAGCELKQLAIQRQPELPGEKRYTMDADLWDLMDKDNQATLILHEVIYREFIEIGHDNSKKARYFHEVVSTPAPESMTMKQYIDLLRLVGLPSADTPKVPICLDKCRTEFYEDGSLRIGVLPAHSQLSIGTLSLDISNRGWMGSSFYPDGSPKELRFETADLLSPLEVHYGPYEKLQFNKWARIDSRLNFDSTGLPLDLNTLAYDHLLTKTHGSMKTRELECEFKMHRTGDLAYGDNFGCKRGKIWWQKKEMDFDSAYVTIKSSGLESAENIEPAISINLPSGVQTSVSGIRLFKDDARSLDWTFLKTAVTLPVQGLKATFEEDVCFYPNGKLKGGKITSATTLKLWNGNKWRFEPKSHLAFDEAGLVINSNFNYASYCK